MTTTTTTTITKSTKSKSDELKTTSQHQRLKLAWNQCKQCWIVIQNLNNEEHMKNECSNLIQTADLDLFDKPYLFKNYANLTLVEHLKGEFSYETILSHLTL